MASLLLYLWKVGAMNKRASLTILLLAIGLLDSFDAIAMVRVKAIGSSPKGQFVAFEEYGFKNGKKLPYSQIRIMNVWKGEYVDSPVYFMSEEDELKDVRGKVKKLAIKKLKKFDISL